MWPLQGRGTRHGTVPHSKGPAGWVQWALLQQHLVGLIEHRSCKFAGCFLKPAPVAGTTCSRCPWHMLRSLPSVKPTGTSESGSLHGYCTVAFHAIPSAKHWWGVTARALTKGLQAQTASPCACGGLCRSSCSASHLMMAVLSPAFASACRTRTCLRWRWWMSGARAAAAAAAAGARASAASALMWRMRSSAGGLASVLSRWPGTLVGPSRFSCRFCRMRCPASIGIGALQSA